MFPPSKIILQILLDADLVMSTDVDWRGFIGFLPNDPDQAVCIYDTDGLMDGRLMKTGERIIHPGIQIIARGRGYAATYSRAQQIALELDTIFAKTLVIDDSLYIVQSVSRTSQVLHLGRETEGDRNRHVFSVNAFITMLNTDDYDFLVVQSSNGPEVLLVRTEEGGLDTMTVRRE